MACLAVADLRCSPRVGTPDVLNESGAGCVGVKSSRQCRGGWSKDSCSGSDPSGLADRISSGDTRRNKKGGCFRRPPFLIPSSPDGAKRNPGQFHPLAQGPGFRCAEDVNTILPSIFKYLRNSAAH
jgi:hypothetical protein